MIGAARRQRREQPYRARPVLDRAVRVMRAGTTLDCNASGAAPPRTVRASARPWARDLAITTRQIAPVSQRSVPPRPSPAGHPAAEHHTRSAPAATPETAADHALRQFRQVRAAVGSIKERGSPPAARVHASGDHRLAAKVHVAEGRAKAGRIIGAIRGWIAGRAARRKRSRRPRRRAPREGSARPWSERQNHRFHLPGTSCPRPAEITVAAGGMDGRW